MLRYMFLVVCVVVPWAAVVRFGVRHACELSAWCMLIAVALALSLITVLIDRLALWYASRVDEHGRKVPASRWVMYWACMLWIPGEAVLGA